MNRIVLSPEARNDLAEIKAYISRELKNPSAALRVVSNIVKQLHVLEKYAEAGPAVAVLTGEDTDIRLLVCDKHTALYRIASDTFYVTRIINSRQDYLRILFGDHPE